MPIQNAKSVERARSNGRRPASGAARPEAVEQRRARLVRMTAPLFLKKGYDNVSIDEIIGVVGGSKATIYAWFGGKEGLFEAVVRQKCQDVTMAIAVDTKGSLEGQLTRIGHSFLAMVLSPPILEFHRLMVSIGRTFPDAGQLFFQSGPVSAYSIVAAWIAKHQQDGSIAAEDPYRLAVLFLDMLIGEHQLGWLTSMPRAARREKIDETVRIAVRVFLRGCAASR
ncbi:MAG: TetR/AcrR family transcriptional regulator, mexJK operon transcriptional repressor [Alphaproteobacteria bacterium]|nr:TetR/AcrR family transcriptional regulator, mexJK operon transcriptional repressor [Alphaproteobacteria bacterium]